MAAIAVGQNLGPYRIVEKLGQGGMADVYKAYQPSLDRYVALKILPPILAREPEFQERFRREAQVIAHLSHPHILQVHDADTKDDIFYIVMQYVAGSTLTSRLGAPLPLDVALRMIQQIGSALDYAHRKGVIHRDVKPANVLMEEGDWPLLSDFGLARLMEASARITKSGVGVGTPEYMAPEQGLGLPVDGRADLYALGVILYEMLVGRVPFLADTPLAVVLKHIHEPLPMPRALNPAIPDSVQRVVLRALAKAPEDRFATASEVGAALESAIREAQAEKATSIVFVAPRHVGDEARAKSVAQETMLGGAAAVAPGPTAQPPAEVSKAPRALAFLERARRVFRRSGTGPRLAGVGAAILILATMLYAGAMFLRGQAASQPTAVSATPAPELRGAPVSETLARADRLLSQGDPAGAVAALEEVTRLRRGAGGESSFVDVMYRARMEMGKELVAKGDYSGATDQFAAIQALRPGDTEAAHQLELASSYAAAESAWGSDWLAAVRGYQKVYEMDPSYGQVRDKLYGSLLELGNSLAARGSLVQARQSLEGATQVNPDGTEALDALRALESRRDAAPIAAPPLLPTPTSRIVIRRPSPIPAAAAPPATITLPPAAPARPPTTTPVPVQPQAPAPTSTPARPARPPGTILFSDNFDDPSGGRLAKESSDPSLYVVGYVDREYVIRTVDATRRSGHREYLPGRYGDSALSVNVRLVGESADRLVEFGCRDRYSLILDPYGGEFFLRRQDEGGGLFLVDRQRHAAIRRANGTNRVEIICAGSTISVRINNTEVASVQDGTYREGRTWIGAGVAPGARLTVEARFNNLVVTQR